MITRAFILLVLVGCSSVRRAPVLFLSDFGNKDGAVATCKGVIYGISPDSPVIDITHDVTPYSITEGAQLLAHTSQDFPSGTVFLAVVEPGVGSTRRPMVFKSKRGQYFVLPDNGLITLVMKQDGMEEAREIQNIASINKSSTFHGRDIFAPVAARVARGEDWKTLGPIINDPVQISIAVAAKENGRITGEVTAIETPYGNLITNIPSQLLSDIKLGTIVKVSFGKKTMQIPYVKTFSDVKKGEPLMFIDSRNTVGFALNQENFAKHFNVHPGVPISFQY